MDERFPEPLNIQNLFIAESLIFYQNKSQFYISSVRSRFSLWALDFCIYTFCTRGVNFCRLFCNANIKQRRNPAKMYKRRQKVPICIFTFSEYCGKIDTNKSILFGIMPHFSRMTFLPVNEIFTCAKSRGTQPHNRRNICT